MKKRIISLLLLVAMLLTILPLTALAEDELVSVEAPDVPNTEIEENVESGDMETSAGDADREKKTADETRIPEVELSEEAEFCYSYAGTAGPNATWTMDDEGTLIISGTGDILSNYWGSYVYENGPEFSEEKVIRIIIQDGITGIGDSVFWYYYENLTDVSIPKSVTWIGDDAFFECSSLKSVTIQEGTISIGKSSFEGCAISDVTIPRSVTSIGEMAFAGCENLSDLTIKNSSVSIGKAAFRGCKELVDDQGFVIVNNTLYDYFGTDVHVTVPDNVTEISDYAFAFNEQIINAVIPEGVTSIGDFVFFQCYALSDVTMPDSLVEIGVRAFDSCSRLKLTIPDRVTTIGGGALHGCSSMADDNGFIISRDILFDYTGTGTKVMIPDGVTEISLNAFAGCRSVTEVTIPDSVTKIDDLAFYQCSSLTSITVPDSVTSIGWKVFAFCESLSEVVISTGLLEVDDNMFNGCRGLADSNGFVILQGILYHYCGEAVDVVVPSSVTGIDGWAFSGGDTQITSVIIPPSVTVIGQGAFGSAFPSGPCYNLKNITVLNATATIRGNFFYPFNGVMVKGLSGSTTEDYATDNFITLKKGWFQCGNDWYYVKGTSIATGWYKVGTKWYYFAKNGIMKTGWVKSGTKWYYLGTSGAMATSKWIKSGTKWYYVGTDGVMATAKWIKSSGKWYYVGSDGVMYTSKWLKSGSSWYYLKSSGVMAASESLTIKGKTYKFNASGVCTNP